MSDQSVKFFGTYGLLGFFTWDIRNSWDYLKIMKKETTKTRADALTFVQPALFCFAIFTQFPHYQLFDILTPLQSLRFGEALRMVQDDLDAKNFYCCNPSYDQNCGGRSMNHGRKMR